MAPIRPPRHGRKKQMEPMAIGLPTTGDSTPITSFFPPEPEPKVLDPPKLDLPAVNLPKIDLPKAAPTTPDPPRSNPLKTELLKADSARPDTLKTEPLNLNPGKMEAPKVIPPKAAILAAKYPPQSGSPHSHYHTTTSRPLADPANTGPPKGDPAKTDPAQVAAHSLYQSTVSAPIPDPPKSDPEIDNSIADRPITEEDSVAFRKGFTFRGPDMIALDRTGHNPLKIEFWLGTPDGHFMNMDLRPSQTPGYTMNDVDLTFRMYNRQTSASGETILNDRIFHTEPDTVYCLHAERGVTYNFDNIPDPTESSSCGMPVGTSLRMMKDRLAFPRMDTPIYHTSTPLDSSSARKCRDYITPLQCDPRGTRCTYPTKETPAATADSSVTDDKDWATRSSPIQYTPSTSSNASTTSSSTSSPAGYIPARLLHHPALPSGPYDLTSLLATHKGPRIFKRCGCGDLVLASADHCNIESGTNRLMAAVGLDLQDDYRVAKRIAMDFFVGHDEGTPIQIDESWYQLDARDYVVGRDAYADVMRRHAEGRHVEEMEERVLRATRMELAKVGSVREGKGRGLNEVLLGAMDFPRLDEGDVGGGEEGAQGPELDAVKWGLGLGSW
ncbi:uncharacterized protein LAJ45_01159 [Morchella importuna]|uniref:uncharacterized protein n=1 Tax=Morchella importuna TaxID=1174673 RepID=UPI001E8E8812|nr:uncharacterized protein LAJ45_01159 [Morchella importuna]KAH8154631.1 hypothetical protein LAJ45_01159 [Morchella importuna]